MKIMFLMGGTNIQKNQEDYPLYLSELNGNLILEQQINYCNSLNPDGYLFCVKTDDIKSYRTDAVIKQILPNSIIIPVNGPTKGAICTALLGAQYLESDEELILMAVDDFIDNEGVEIVNYFKKENADAGVVSFTSIHPRYSFAKINENNDVVEVAEKKPISKNALVSFYYFRHANDFLECAKDVIRKDNSVNGSFYISQTLNEMILRQKKVKMYKVENEKFHPLKTEMQLAQYMFELKEEKDSK